MKDVGHIKEEIAPSIQGKDVFSQEEITVEKIWKTYDFYPQSGGGYSAMADGLSYTYQEKNNSIVKRQFEGSGSDEVLFTPPGQDFSYSRYEFNSDESKILFLTDLSSIYRYSYVANYYLYDCDSKKLEPLDEKHQPQTLAEYSPDGNFVIVSSIKRPFSYIVTYGRFPRSISVHDDDGNLISNLANIPLVEELPKGFNSVRKGKRNFSWRMDKPSSMIYAQALDSGDPEIKVDSEVNAKINSLNNFVYLI